ncbi:MAG: ATP-binding cassette domain-containing protein [Culicoidibacterales bacterium]
MIVKIRNLSFNYDDKQVFEKFDCDILSGITCISGENGIGKTTLLNCIAGIIDYSGTIVIDKSKKITYLTNEDYLFDFLTVEENINYFCNLFYEKKEYKKNVVQFLKVLNLDIDYQNTLVKNLSQGMRNKVFLGITLQRNADIILMDEPFTALDRDSMDQLVEFLKVTKKDIVYTTHIDEFKNIADNHIRL